MPQRAAKASRSTLIDEAVAIVAPPPAYVVSCRDALSSLVDRYLCAHAAWNAAPRQRHITDQLEEIARLCRELEDRMNSLDPIASAAIVRRITHRRMSSFDPLPSLPLQLMVMAKLAAEAAALRRGVIVDPITGNRRPAADRGGNTRGPGFRRPQELLVAWLAELLDVFDRRKTITSPKGEFVVVAGLLHEAAFGNGHNMSSWCRVEAKRWRQREPRSFPQG
ncbi:MAG: hypothetical protein U1E45_05655 [Geminicoccaceae bacterium]